VSLLRQGLFIQLSLLQCYLCISSTVQSTVFVLATGDIMQFMFIYVICIARYVLCITTMRLDSTMVPIASKLYFIHCTVDGIFACDLRYAFSSCLSLYYALLDI
jgi:hypothetical protein